MLRNASALSKSTLPLLKGSTHACKSFSVTRPGITNLSTVTAPSSVEPSIPGIQAIASPIVKPVYVALTPAFNQKASEPTPQEHVVALDPEIFNHPIRRDILHLVVTHYRDSLRQGSANTKTRGEVAGSGRKIRPQKGTGKARLGDAQSPMLRGGGVAFGPKPRDFSTKLPRKVIQMGMRVALSAKVKEQKFGVMTRLDWPSGKTKHLAQRLSVLGLKDTLFITGEGEVPVGLERAIRNIPLVSAISADKLNVYELLQWSRVVLDCKAVEYFERALGKDHRYIPPTV
ncbi:50s ribosomal protein l4 [Moniliophthora roreri MCA 2997]|uniref:Large ribosomal subunit protein uL4m n=2 Tax=Moniliophthora roreri TaxID=221103 RepID=V2XFD0_MONRO|nr:50s ribosomal protein l4 [Moniliophthora roreri MCA 2997]KAI3621804.1 50s ribosomal protein l4 [Moniliophthora roreri]